MSGATSGCVSGVFMLRGSVGRLSRDGGRGRSKACGGAEAGLRRVVEERLRTIKSALFVEPFCGEKGSRGVREGAKRQAQTRVRHGHDDSPPE
jgi:hypothetical protein